MLTSEHRSGTQPELCECPSCGLLQTLPVLATGMAAQCARCPTTLYRTKVHRNDRSTVLTLAALVLLIMMSSTTLMTVQTAGIELHAALLSGPEELVRRDVAPPGAVGK